MKNWPQAIVTSALDTPRGCAITWVCPVCDATHRPFVPNGYRYVDEMASRLPTGSCCRGSVLHSDPQIADEINFQRDLRRRRSESRRQRLEEAHLGVHRAFDDHSLQQQALTALIDAIVEDAQVAAREQAARDAEKEAEEASRGWWC